MVNINLSTAQSSKRKFSLASHGMMTGIAVLILVVLVSAGIYFWKQSLNKQVSSLEKERQGRSARLLEGRNRDVIDFQTRIFALNDLVRQENPVTSALQKIEGAMVSGVYVNFFEYDKSLKIFKLNCVAENHDAIARQIASLKNVANFSAIDLRETKVSDKGGVEFLIEITTE